MATEATTTVTVNTQQHQPLSDRLQGILQHESARDKLTLNFLLEQTEGRGLFLVLSCSRCPRLPAGSKCGAWFGPDVPGLVAWHLNDRCDCQICRRLRLAKSCDEQSASRQCSSIAVYRKTGQTSPHTLDVVARAQQDQRADHRVDGFPAGTPDSAGSCSVHQYVPGLLDCFVVCRDDGRRWRDDLAWLRRSACTTAYFVFSSHHLRNALKLVHSLAK